MVSKTKAKKLPGPSISKPKKENPFSLHHTRRKFNVLGQSAKGTKGKPTITRQKAFDHRSKTLLVEYMNRHKKNVLTDKRIGELNPALDDEVKLEMRKMQELKRKHSKKSLYNLNDDEEYNFAAGIPLTANLDDDDDLGEDGMLDAKFVKEQHFGGLPGVEEDPARKQMSNKDRFEEIIQQSKQNKLDAKQLKEEQYTKIKELDSQLKDFQSAMCKFMIRDSDVITLQKSRRTELRTDFDVMCETLNRERLTGGISRPTERIKSDAEIRKEEEERLAKLEAERLQRMKGDYELEEPKAVTRSADSLDDAHTREIQKKLAIEYKDGKLMKESKASNNLKEAPGVTGGGGTQQKSILKSKSAGEVKAQQSSVENYEVPRNYEGFWDLLAGRTPKEVSAFLEKMINSNHPRIQHANKLKCSDIFTFLLQTLNVLCEVGSSDTLSTSHSSLEYIDALMAPLFTLTELDPEHCAKALLLVFIEKRDEYREQSKKRYPYLDTMVFLQLAGVLFPASDFYHPVMTPVKTFLTQVLGEARIRDGRGVLASVYTATLLQQYIVENGKFLAELKNVLFGLLLRCVPSDVLDSLEDDPVPLTWVLSSSLPPPALLPLKADASKLRTLPKFELSMLNEDSLQLTDGLRCTVLIAIMQNITDLCSTWAELPSVREIMLPLHTLLPLLPVDKYPPPVIEAKLKLEKALRNLPPHPPRLKVDKGRPKPLRMLEPEIQEVKLNEPKSSWNKSDQQKVKQKLLYYVKRERKAAKREILKDNKFLAKQKLKETLASDSERKKKVKLIMHDLQSQESEYKKYQKLKLSGKH